MQLCCGLAVSVLPSHVASQVLLLPVIMLPCPAAQKEKDAKEGKGKQGANVDTEMSLPHRASDMDELDIVIKLHRVERHIRKNKLKVPCQWLCWVEPGSGNPKQPVPIVSVT